MNATLKKYFLYCFPLSLHEIKRQFARQFPTNPEGAYLLFCERIKGNTEEKRREEKRKEEKEATSRLKYSMSDFPDYYSFHKVVIRLAAFLIIILA